LRQPFAILCGPGVGAFWHGPPLGLRIDKSSTSAREVVLEDRGKAGREQGGAPRFRRVRPAGGNDASLLRARGAPASLGLPAPHGGAALG